MICICLAFKDVSQSLVPLYTSSYISLVYCALVSSSSCDYSTKPQSTSIFCVTLLFSSSDTKSWNTKLQPKVSASVLYFCALTKSLWRTEETSVTLNVNNFSNYYASFYKYWLPEICISDRTFVHFKRSHCDFLGVGFSVSPVSCSGSHQHLSSWYIQHLICCCVSVGISITYDITNLYLQV